MKATEAGLSSSQGIEETLKYIEGFRTYKGGDASDRDMNQASVDNMQEIAKLCDGKQIPQPEYFPFYDASGAQAEWDTGIWYMEIDSRRDEDGSEETSLLVIKRTGRGKYENAFACRCSIENAVSLAEIFWTYVFR